MGFIDAKAGVFKILTERLPDVFTDKSARYGESWYSEDAHNSAKLMFGEVHAKYKRLWQQAWLDDQKDKAGCVETYLDLALYCVLIAAVLEDGMTQDEKARLEAKLRA